MPCISAACDSAVNWMHDLVIILYSTKTFNYARLRSPCQQTVFTGLHHPLLSETVYTAHYIPQIFKSDIPYLITTRGTNS